MEKQLPVEVREFAEYRSCEKFAREFMQKHPYHAVYRRIMLRRKTTSDVFFVKSYNYLSHTWIEYKGMLLMAYSGTNPSEFSFTVGEHFKRNTLTPDQLHKKIIEFKQYCADVTDMMQKDNIVPTDFIENVGLYQNQMFGVGLCSGDIKKLEDDFKLDEASTFSFEIVVTNIKGSEVIFAGPSAVPGVVPSGAGSPTIGPSTGGPVSAGGKKYPQRKRRLSKIKKDTKRRIPTKRRHTKRRHTKRRHTKRRR